MNIHIVINLHAQAPVQTPAPVHNPNLEYIKARYRHHIAKLRIQQAELKQRLQERRLELLRAQLQEQSLGRT